MNPHFTGLEAAFQLRYYLCFKTQYLKPTLGNAESQDLARQVLSDVCERQRYHLLETSINQDHMRLLISLQPKDTISKTVQMLKGNLQYQFGKYVGPKVQLAEGYFARSVGRVTLERVRDYVDNQVPARVQRVAVGAAIRQFPHNDQRLHELSGVSTPVRTALKS